MVSPEITKSTIQSYNGGLEDYKVDNTKIQQFQWSLPVEACSVLIETTVYKITIQKNGGGVALLYTVLKNHKVYNT